jgi:hypothetical protein
MADTVIEAAKTYPPYMSITVYARCLAIADKQALSETSPPVRASRWTERRILWCKLQNAAKAFGVGVELRARVPRK